MKIIILSGSIRSSQKNLNKIKEISLRSSDIEEYAALCRQDIQDGASYCNSDIMAGASLMGIYQQDLVTEPFSLASLFSQTDYNTDSESPSSTYDNLTVLNNEQRSLFEKIEESVGIVLITPVYFGDRSSVANKVMQLAGKFGFLKNKTFGAGSVGAKRNGGQETATLYCLFEALRKGAIVVGNGQPTSQYGGTAIGGHRGTIAKDVWGLTTAYGVANRVAQVSKLCNAGKTSPQSSKVRILVLVTMDNSSKILLKQVEEYASKLSQENKDAEFVLMDVLQHKIYRCLGCKLCPRDGILPGDSLAECCIKNSDDGMKQIQEELIQADGILVAGLNIQDAQDITYRYQVMIERTRYIRRDNFELSNKLISSFTLHEVGASVNQLHHVKTVTSYIRHNVVMSKPVEAYMHDNQIIVDGYDAFRQFIQWATVLKQGRENTNPEPQLYVTSGVGGYE